MKKNIGAQLALYPAPVIVVGAIVNDKPTWTLVAHAGTMAYSHLMVSLVHAHYINQEIIESKKYMDLDILYPDKSTKMKVDFSEYISISSKINVQARMEAEDFVMYMALNQSKYLMKEEREDRLPLNKEALKRFSETWTINLASSLEKDDGRVQFENYLDTCVLDN